MSRAKASTSLNSDRASLKKPALKKDEPAQLEYFLKAHERFVTRKSGGVRLIYKFGDLRGIFLQLRQLSEIDFTGCDLSGAKLAMAQFERASFYCATLENADCRGTNLCQADLRGVKLRGSNLYGAKLDDSDFRDALLARADVDQGYRLVGGGIADPETENGGIRSVDFRDCSLKRARLGGARLQGADFSGANLDGANLTGARLDNANLTGAILTGVDLKSARLFGAVLQDCVLDPTAEALARSDLLRDALLEAEKWLASKRVIGAAAQLASEDLRPLRGEMKKRRLPGLAAADCCGIDVDFSESLLTAANFAGADLRGARFAGADLRGANFRNCKLAHADFSGADLSPLPFGDDSVQITNFDEATLTGAIFTGPGRAIRDLQLRATTSV